MRVVVIEGPEPIITPADVPGEHDGDDAHVAALIAASQAEIDGPTGWLGRALGVQTIECHADQWPSELPYRPLLGFVSATVDGELVEGVKMRLDGRLVLPAGAPSGETVIRYRAGYDGSTTGKVPANAKAAVILAVNLLRSFAADGLFVEQEQTNGVGTTTYSLSKDASHAVERTIGNLLAPLRVFS